MRVLLVEDDPTTSKSIEMMLTHANLNVYATDMGEEGVDLAKLYDYDLILLDLNLPDMTGHEVLRQNRLARITTPILILSGKQCSTPRRTLCCTRNARLLAWPCDPAANAGSFGWFRGRDTSGDCSLNAFFTKGYLRPKFGTANTRNDEHKQRGEFGRVDANGVDVH